MTTCCGKHIGFFGENQMTSWVNLSCIFPSLSSNKFNNIGFLSHIVFWNKGEKLDWFSYTFGFWISAHIKDTKKLQGDNSVEAQRSNVEVNVRESMVKVLVIETNWKQSLWIPRCCCKQTVCISCECDKVSKQFSLFSFTGKWPCWLWGLSMHWHHFRKGGIIVLIFFKLNLCSLFPRNFVFIFETSPTSEARNSSNMNIVFVISTL